MTFEEFCEKELAPIRVLEVTNPYTLSLMRKSYESGQADIINKLKNGDVPGYLIVENTKIIMKEA